MNKHGRHVEKSGNVVWYLHGKFHREGGPAIEWSDGDKGWFHHGDLHRLDGPAMESENEEWWIHGNLLDEDEVEIAKRLLDGGLRLAPLYVNHPSLKYICQFVLEKSVPSIGVNSGTGTKPRR